MRAEQTVSEMVVGALARQAEALAERSGRTFEEAFAEVLETPAGRELAELSDGPHRHKKARDWQDGLLRERARERLLHLVGPKAKEATRAEIGRSAERNSSVLRVFANLAG